MARCRCSPATAAVAVLAVLESVAALPQAQSSSPSSSRATSSRTSSSSSSGRLVGTISSATSIRLPAADPTGYPDNSDLPSSAIPADPDIPDYAITYAPVVYLHTNESYWPSSLDYHLQQVTPWIDYDPLNNIPRPLTLENMDFVNNAFYYLSVQNPAIEPQPDWYYSTYGKPDSTGYSGGNVTVIAVNKTESIEPGVVDVFYFLFYSFNDGNDVGGQKYGNHVSDIEHIMIRFYSGEPRYMFLSQHEDGTAYEWAALQKDGNRPIAYSAIGGHANYPVAGTFDLVTGLIGLIDDNTAAGPRWDTVLNYNGYWWSGDRGFVNANGTRASTWPNGPPNNGYLKQRGKWGNQALREDDPSQETVFGQEAWSDGATGPVDPSKGLDRTWLCIKVDCIANSTLPTSDAVQANAVQTTSGSERAFSWTITLSFFVACLSSVVILL